MDSLPIIITYLYLAAFSYHSDCRPGTNENNNPVFGIEFSVGDGHYQALTLPNSNRVQSILLAKKHYLADWYGIKPGIFYGGVTGYRNDKSDPLPFIAPILTVDIENVSSELACLADHNTTVCIFAARYKF